MNKLYIVEKDKEMKTTFSRSRAKGYKAVKVDSGVEPMKPIKLETEGNDLVIKNVSDDGSGDEVYMIPCKEFGLVDYPNTTAKVSVILCDDGWMLVTLLKGAIVINLDDSLLMPTVDCEEPAVVKDAIKWVNINDILSYMSYWSEGKFPYDYEWVFELAGGVVNGMGNYKIHPVKEELVDISQGYIAQYEQSRQHKEDAKKAKSFMNAVMASTQDTGVEFDDDDEDDYFDEDEDEEYEEVDW